MWEDEDQPLADGNWPLIAPSPLPYLPGTSQIPREMTRADMDAVRDEFVAATQRADEAGFDLLEIHMAHGYLLSAFLSPLTNVRDGRVRRATARISRSRSSRPAARPGPPRSRCSVRISATDWVEGGFDGDDAVAFARRLVDGGLRHRRRLHRPGLARPAAGLRAQLPDALRRPDPPRGGDPGDRRRRDLELRRRQHDHPRRPRRPLRAGAPAPLGSALDPARRRRPGSRHGLDSAVPLGFAARRTRARTCAGCRCGASNEVHA